MRKRRITAVVLSAMMCFAVVGLSGCAPKADEGDQAQEPEAAATQEQEQEAAAPQEQEAAAPQEQEAAATPNESQAQEPFIGTWKLYELTTGGETVSHSDVEASGMNNNVTFEVSADGTATLKATGIDSVTGTWKANGTTLTLTSEGESMDFTLDGDKLSTSIEGGDEYVFEKADSASGNAAPAASNDSTSDSSSSMTSSGTPMASDFEVKDLKIEETGYSEYTVTGTLANNGSKDAGRVIFDLTCTEHETDDYGDDVPNVSSTIPSSMTPKVIGDTFFDMKAGEERPFTLVFYNNYPCTDPVMSITEVLSGADSDSSTVLFGYDEFDVTLSYNRGLERCEASITSNLDVPISNCTLYYAYLGKYGGNPDNSEGTWEEAEYSVTKSFGLSYDERIWPGKTFECTPDANNVPREDLMFLGMTYEIDEEAAASNVWDEFAIDIDEDAQVVSITNNTGHYLEDVTLLGAATDSSGTRNIEAWNAEHVAPGKTADMSTIQYVSECNDINIFDIGYEIDEDKEEQTAS